MIDVTDRLYGSMMYDIRDAVRSKYSGPVWNLVVGNIWNGMDRVEQVPTHVYLKIWNELR